MAVSSEKEKKKEKSSRVLDTRLLGAPLFRVCSVFIPGFVSHHDTYFSLKQNRLFVTIVSLLLSLTAKHNGFKAGGEIKASFWTGGKKKREKKITCSFHQR